MLLKDILLVRLMQWYPISQLDFAHLRAMVFSFSGIVKRTRSGFMNMAKLSSFLLATATAWGISVTSVYAESPETIKEDAVELLNSIRQYSAEQKEELVKNTQSLLARFDKKIEEAESSFDKKWDSMSESAKKKSERTLERLKKERDEAKSWLEDAKESNAKTWSSVKGNLAESLTRLRERLQDSDDSLHQSNQQAQNKSI